MNIKQVRKELIYWGRFWASRESLQGYASTSVTERCCEVLKTGIWASSDKHLFNHQSDNIFVPQCFKALDSIVFTLPVPQRAAINRRYIKLAKLTNTERIALINAEMTILSEF